MRAKRMLISLLAAALLLGGCPAAADGEELPAPEDLFLLGEASEYGEIAFAGFDDTPAPDADTFSTDAAFGVYAGDLWTDGAASSYDPRNAGVLPPVRAQGSWNTCWAFTAIAAAELDGLTKDLLYDPNSIDLSERHLIYFFSHQAEDPLGNSSGDYNLRPDFWIQNGGNPVIAAMTFAGWHGAAEEAATGSAYSGLTANDSLPQRYAYADVLHLENTYALDISTAAGRSALKTMIGQHGGAVLTMYYSSAYLFAGSPSAQNASAAADAVLPADVPPEADPMEKPVTDAEGELEVLLEEDASFSAAPAPETALPAGEETVPPEAEALSEEDEWTAPADDTAPAEAEEISIEAEDIPAEAEDTPEEDVWTIPAGDAGETPEGVSGLDGAAEEELWFEGDPDAGDFTVCYYQDSTRSTNHEVFIVGWDDSYPAANFGYSAKGAVPPGNGAWLCRNSLGGSWSGGDGYFWLSYYDASAAAATGSTISGHVTVFDFGPADNYAHNYEYDGAAVLGYVNDAVGGKGISTASASASTRRWYANIFTAKANINGDELLRAAATYTYRGDVAYTAQVYTDLTDPADPTSGVLAAEVSGNFPYAGFHTVELPEPVRLREGSLFSVVFRIGAAGDKTLFVPACYTSVNWYSSNDSAAGQSFVSLDGSAWLDCKGLKNEPNVRIKAYTDDTARRVEPAASTPAPTPAPTPTSVPSAALPFTDVSAGAWYYEDVLSCWRQGIMNGSSDTVFSPQGSATRAQIAAVLHRLDGGEPAIASVSFDDVARGSWYYDDVRWAEGLGIVSGSDDDGDGVYSFRPTAAVTRQELMTILYRYAKLRGGDVSQRADLSAFGDSGRVASWARDAVAWSVAAGLLQGVPSGGSVLISPQGKVTRAQLAAFLNRLSF